MSNSSPNFGYWRNFMTLKIWQVAAMMKNIEPCALGDITDQSGDGIDLFEEVQTLISAALAGGITAYPIPGQLPTAMTEVLVTSMDTWLRQRGYVDLANDLAQAPPSSPAPVAVAPASSANVNAGSSVKPISRFAAQESAILAEILALGHIPTKLPGSPPGRPGVKAQVKAALGRSGIWSGPTVFGKAWDRLRLDTRIATKS